jgi:hypothetical protein
MIIIQLCKIIILGCNFVKDDNSFLFVLSKASGASSTTKLPQDKGGIWCSASYGAVFGSSVDKNIKLIHDGSSSGCKISSTSYGFKVPGGGSLYSFIGIGESVTLNYLEIFP